MAALEVRVSDRAAFGHVITDSVPDCAVELVVGERATHVGPNQRGTYLVDRVICHEVAAWLNLKADIASRLHGVQHIPAEPSLGRWQERVLVPAGAFNQSPGHP